MTPQQYNLNKAGYTVAELVDVLRISRSRVYRLVNSGALHRTKCGRQTLFLAVDVAAMLDGLRTADQAARP